KIYTKAGINQLIDDDSCCAPKSNKGNPHSENDGYDHEHEQENKTKFQLFIPAILSFLLLILGIGFDNWISQDWFVDWVRPVWYIIAYAPVGFPVLKEAFESIKRGDVFSEFF